MVLWIVAVVLAVVGVVQLLQGQVVLAVAFFIAAVLVGPAVKSISGSRRTA